MNWIRNRLAEPSTKTALASITGLIGIVGGQELGNAAGEVISAVGAAVTALAHLFALLRAEPRS